MVTRMLSLSTGTTTLAGPSCNARDRSFQLGGQEMENPEDLPLLGAFLGTFGSVDYGAEEAPAAPAAPNAPAAPTAAS